MIFETFARRKRQQNRNGEPEIYTYDQAPEHMRHQICSALAEGIGFYYGGGGYHEPPPNADLIWEQIDRICRKEMYSYLSYTQETDLRLRFLNYVRHVQDIDHFLSAVEIGCLVLRISSDEYDSPKLRGGQQKGVDAIEEINGRFEQHSVGYQFENGQIIRVDSKLPHAESYVAMLKAGLPAVRNDAGGHGEGLTCAAVTAGIARFAINLTATNLVFLGDSYSAMKSGQRRR
jgi:hypothetical protein